MPRGRRHRSGFIRRSRPVHLDHEALLAGFAWEGVKEKRDAILKRWAIARFNDGAAKFKSAQELLLKAATTPFYSTCLNYTYTYVGGGDFPRQYPGEALDKLLAQPEDETSSKNSSSQQLPRRKPTISTSNSWNKKGLTISPHARSRA